MCEMLDTPVETEWTHVLRALGCTRLGAAIWAAIATSRHVGARHHKKQPATLPVGGTADTTSLHTYFNRTTGAQRPRQPPSCTGPNQHTRKVSPYGPCIR